MQKVRKGKIKTNINKKKRKKDEGTCSLVKEKKTSYVYTVCCVHYMPNCSSFVSFGKDPV